MSRSYKKNNIGGNAGGSDKYDKQLSNRKFRKKRSNDNTEDDFYDDIKEVSNKWTFKKDGKSFGKDAKYRRK